VLAVLSVLPMLSVLSVLSAVLKSILIIAVLELSALVCMFEPAAVFVAAVAAWVLQLDLNAIVREDAVALSVADPVVPARSVGGFESIAAAALLQIEGRLPNGVLIAVIGNRRAATRGTADTMIASIGGEACIKRSTGVFVRAGSAQLAAQRRDARLWRWCRLWCWLLRNYELGSLRETWFCSVFDYEGCRSGDQQEGKDKNNAHLLGRQIRR